MTAPTITAVFRLEEPGSADGKFCIESLTGGTPWKSFMYRSHFSRITGCRSPSGAPSRNPSPPAWGYRVQSNAGSGPRTCHPPQLQLSRQRLLDVACAWLGFHNVRKLPMFL